MATSKLVNDSRTVHRVPINNLLSLKMDNEPTEAAFGQRARSKNSVISVQNLCKSYGKDNKILKNLTMTVNQGELFCVLGSSGCGKTTILSCIVGLKKWDSGEIFLFGRKVNEPLGNRGGYMPQDLSLHGILSIQETMAYYGRLYGMTNEDIEEKGCQIVKLLQLPNTLSLIKNLSGGQKRRVSLAVSLIHSPELLILDEPTVGMDPLLRESIWEHLRKITSTGKTTVIMTTHYIEETRSSSKIGLIRNGRLLVEDTPTNLLNQYQCELLEQVVHKLCIEDENVVSTKRTGNNKVSFKDYTETASKNELSTQHRSIPVLKESAKCRLGQNIQEKSKSTMFGRITALSKVIWLTLIRNITFMAMIILLPTLQILVTVAVQGQPPKDLKFGIVNQDTQASCDHNRNVSYYEENIIAPNISTCNLQHLSCDLIAELSKSETFLLVPIESTQIAQKEVNLGNLWGYFQFPYNYSQHLSNLALEKMFAENITLANSRVHLFMDMSNLVVNMVSTADVLKIYQQFLSNFALDCGISPLELELPMVYREPIYGDLGISMHQYFIPVILLGTIFWLSALWTAVFLISDRKQGTVDRAVVAGVRFNEVIFSHMIIQALVVIAQILLLVFALHFVHDVRVKGSYILFLSLCLLAGLCGQAVGILHGVVLDHEIETMLVGSTVIITIYTYNGAFWPIEGMSKLVRNIAYFFPTTLLVESIRSSIYRGVDILSGFVWPGIVVSMFWTISFWVISVLVFRKKLT